MSFESDCCSAQSWCNRDLQRERYRAFPRWEERAAVLLIYALAVRIGAVGLCIIVFRCSDREFREFSKRELVRRRDVAHHLPPCNSRARRYVTYQCKPSRDLSYHERRSRCVRARRYRCAAVDEGNLFEVKLEKVATVCVQRTRESFGDERYCTSVRKARRMSGTFVRSISAS